MCDVALSFAREILLPMVNFVNEIRGLPEEVEKMKDELRNIQTQIYTEDSMGATEKVDREKVKELLERFFRLEDLLDEYTICNQWTPATDPPPPLAALPSEAAGFMNTMSRRVLMACKIKYFKWQHKIKKDDQGSSSLSSSHSGHQDVAVRNLQEAALLLNEADVVGFESEKQTLIDLLTKGRKERTVVAVVAMGGQGKTTLANQVFKNQQVIEYFPYHAWVTVSQSYTVEGLLRTILQEFYKQQNQSPPEGIFTMDSLSLKKQLKSYLGGGKRYAICFDDVWNPNFWDELEHALTDNESGSRILITTRDKKVLDSCKKSSFVEMHELKPLSEEKSLELFYNKAFYDLNGCCPLDLVNVSSKIVSKCGGLPLAIVAIGGALASKGRETHAWDKFIKYLSSELENKSSLDAVKKILGFSYDDLPPFLKPCFLYFGMYPEDYEVKSQRLIRQWIAEGFIKEQNGIPLEKVARGYLNELIRRSLVQPASFTLDGRVKSCRIHDLLRDLILKKNEDLSFCHFITEDAGHSELSGKSRRISIATDFKKLLMMRAENIRSILHFFEEPEIVELMRMIFSNYKLLKVLDFEDLDMTGRGVPENLGTLIHLRYLSFRHTWLRHLPESISKLENLETLDLSTADVQVLPKGVGKLKKLRHLMTSHHDNLIALKDSIGRMTSLQTLRDVSLDFDEAVELIRELEKLTQLRVLTFSEVRDEHKTALCSLLNKMQHLEKLSMWVCRPAPIDQHPMPLDPRAMPMLQALKLAGTLLNHTFISGLQNLVKLRMTGYQLTVDAFKSLQNMSKLLLLEISASDYNSDTLHVYDGGFPNLKRLELHTIEGIRYFHIERGALPSLEELTLDGMSGLKEMPEGFQHLKNLQHLVLRIQTAGVDVMDSQQRQIVQHVPRVDVNHSSSNNQSILRFTIRFGKLEENMQKGLSGLN